MHIGILQCDSVRADLKPEFGDYPDMFRHLLANAADEAAFSVFDLPAGQFPESLAACDAWLFTGSKWSVYDAEPWIERAHDIAQALHEARRPTIGICFGHQLIARALGGSVTKAPQGWGVGVHTMRILAQRPWMQPRRDTLAVLVSHQDQVQELPEEAEQLATHEFCPFDMAQIGEHILTFQGHPEFAKGYSRAVMDMRRDRLGESTYESGMESLAEPIEPGVAAAWISGFLRHAHAHSSQHG